MNAKDGSQASMCQHEFISSAFLAAFKELFSMVILLNGDFNYADSNGSIPPKT